MRPRALSYTCTSDKEVNNDVSRWPTKRLVS